jgi:Holliday junction resolvase
MNKCKANLTETDIRKQLVYYLRLKGWFVYHCLAGLGGYPGLSDLVAVKGGRIVHVEVKRPGTGKQSANQIQFEADLTAAGGEYLLARGIEDLEEAGM